MPRPVTLFTGQWADLPLEELAGKASAWGFDGLELACWGDHFDVDEALADPGYVAGRRELLDRYGLQCHAISTHLVSQAVCDPVDERHRAILPPDVWGDGDPEGVRRRAADKVKDAARAAARFGVTTVNGFTGSSIWHLLYSFPPNDFEAVEAGYRDFAERWSPIIDVFEAEGVRFGLEVHPTEIAYDFVTTRKALDAIDRREGFGINFDPSHFAHQFLDSAAFIGEFADRIYHVHVKDSQKSLDGRSSILGGHLNFGEVGSRLGLRLAGARGRRLRVASSAPSTGSATRGRSRSSGRMPAWTANGAPRTRWPSSAGATSPRPRSPSTPPTRGAEDRIGSARLNRLFAADGRCFDVAVDHGFFGEPSFLTGIEDLEKAVRTLVDAGPDAIQLSPGEAPLLQRVAGPRKPTLVLRTDVANVYGASPPRLLWSELVEDAVGRAVRLDAACVVVNLLSLPGEPELYQQCVRNISTLRAACDPLGMPLMVEPLAMKPGEAGYGVNGDADTVVTLVRQAVELGADVVKADPTDDLDEYGRVVQAAGRVPVLVRGGGRAPDEEILGRTEAVLQQGAAGIVYGRNVVQHADPAGMTRALMAIVHEGASAEKALADLAARA